MKYKLKVFAAAVGVAAIACAMLYGYRMLFHGKGASSAEARSAPAEGNDGEYPAGASRVPEQDAFVSSTAKAPVAGSPSRYDAGTASSASTGTNGRESDIVTGMAAAATATAAEIAPDAEDDLPYCD